MRENQVWIVKTNKKTENTYSKNIFKDLESFRLSELKYLK